MPPRVFTLYGSDGSGSAAIEMALLAAGAKVRIGRHHSVVPTLARRCPA